MNWLKKRPPMDILCFCFFILIWETYLSSLCTLFWSTFILQNLAPLYFVQYLVAFSLVSICIALGTLTIIRNRKISKDTFVVFITTIPLAYFFLFSPTYIHTYITYIFILFLTIAYLELAKKNISFNEASDHVRNNINAFCKMHINILNDFLYKHSTSYDRPTSAIAAPPAQSENDVTISNFTTPQSEAPQQLEEDVTIANSTTRQSEAPQQLEEDVRIAISPASKSELHEHDDVFTIEECWNKQLREKNYSNETINRLNTFLRGISDRRLKKNVVKELKALSSSGISIFNQMEKDGSLSSIFNTQTARREDVIPILAKYKTNNKIKLSSLYEKHFNNLKPQEYVPTVNNDIKIHASIIILQMIALENPELTPITKAIKAASQQYCSH